MCRGGRRAGSGVKKGVKRGPYTKKAATKKRSEPSAASTAMLSAFVVRRKRQHSDEAPQDELDDGAHVLGVDDKATVRANVRAYAYSRLLRGAPTVKKVLHIVYEHCV